MDRTRKISSMTGESIAALDAQIAEAQKNYQKMLADYNWGMTDTKASRSYAERVRWPRVESAKQIVDSLISQKDSILKNMQTQQGIDIAGQIATNVTSESESSMPWGIIGLAVGAIILIIIVIKVF